MIRALRNSLLVKSFSISMILIMFFTMILPINSFALTGGPAQPEFNSFTPIGVSDMVDLTSGDFSYNIPIMDIGGFPINLSYSSGITTDQEASWVGLGWNMSIGQINRQMRGIPDDFSGKEVGGDEMTYENYIKNNYTLGSSVTIRPALFGLESQLLSIGVSAQYNSYSGVSISPSIGANFDLGNITSVGLNVTSSPDGLTVSPNLSLHSKYKTKQSRDNNLGASFGLSFNARQGLSNFNMSASRTSYLGVKMNGKSGQFNSGGNIGSSISFVDNHYTPTIQNGITSNNFTFNAALDATFIGVDGGSQIRAFGSQQYINSEDQELVLKAYGYENNHFAQEDDIRDFNREKDGNFSVNSTNLPLTHQTYDIYSVQGQGVSGMFRPYRSNIGYVSDNKKTNTNVGGTLGTETGSGNAFRLGIDVEVTNTSTEVGSWDNDNDAKTTLTSSSSSTPEYEEVYYKNVGDLSADPEQSIFGEISDFTTNPSLGGYQPIRIKLGGSEYNRSANNKYEIKDIDPLSTPGQFNFYNSPNFTTSSFKRTKRVQRNQNILKIRNEEISNPDGDLLGFTINTNAKKHHTAGFIITRNDGARYIYGEALYNTAKEEVSFAVGLPKGKIYEFGDPSEIYANCSSGLVQYNHGVDNSTNNRKGDHYYNRISTPAYAHTYLLTALVSTDYSDIDNNGLSDNDLGSWTKFTYSNQNDPTVVSSNYKWRVPYGNGLANYNEGLKTDRTDDKGSYVSGEKEVKYIKEIETKTHIAIFHLSPRADGIGANENGSMDENSLMYKVDKISLYSKGEYDWQGINSTSTPIKEAHFVYDYELCQGIPNFEEDKDISSTEIITDKQGGKLTLQKVYFTYRNSNMGKYSSYDFTYGDINHDGTVSQAEGDLRNPDYNLKAYDIWGNYAPNLGICGIMGYPTAPEYNYVDQEDPNTNEYAAAWSVTDIELPSGGIIKIDYEADDYTHVQDKETMRMFKVVGAGSENLRQQIDHFDHLDLYDNMNQTLSQTIGEALLYQNNGSKINNKYLYVQLDEEDQSSSFTVVEFKEKYVDPIINEQDGLMYFRFLINMTEDGGKGDDNSFEPYVNDDDPFEYVTGYVKVSVNVSDYNVFGWGGGPGPDGTYYGVIPIEPVELESGLFIDGGSPNVSANPISLAAWNFGRKYLPKYVYEINDPAGNASESEIIKTSLRVVENVKELINGPNKYLRDKLIGRRFIPEKSWVRLANPKTYKKGGGIRVKQIVMTDEWARLSATTAEPYNSNDPYDDDIRNQKYGQEYKYKLENGHSSGVATYEPIGCKENPLVQPSFVTEKRLLAPDEENYIEMPFGESFYPSPTVTYGRVTVKNLEREDDKGTPDTSDDLIVKKHATGHVVTEHYTSKDYPVILDQTPIEIFEDQTGFLAALLSINAKKHLTLTQGYVIHLNDMNGKLKSQRVYAEGQDIPISGADYIYENNTTTDLSGYDNQGKLNNRVHTLSPDGTINNNHLIGVEHDVFNDFREMKSETETVGVNTNFATFLLGLFPATVPLPLPDYAKIEDKLNMATTTKVINTFGIQREMIAYDAGAKVSTKNLLWDAETGEVLLTRTVNEYDDYYYSFNYPAYWYYEGMGMASKNSGSEIPFSSISTPFHAASSAYSQLLEIGDEVLINKVNIETGLITPFGKAWVSEKIGNHDFSLIGNDGVATTLSALSSGETYKLRVIRSNKRNLQSTSMGSLVLMNNPLTNLSSFLISVSETDKIINAGIVEFSDEWERQCECRTQAEEDEPHRNEFVHNEKGVWRAKESKLYLTGRNQDADPIPRGNGFFNLYHPYYELNGSDWEISETNSDKWTGTSEVSKYSQYGAELENKDALDRYSSAQYGYNYMFPMAVSANSRYGQMGFDGFEDYDFLGCPTNEHFGFRDLININEDISDTEAHTGNHSILIKSSESILKILNLSCP